MGGVFGLIVVFYRFYAIAANSDNRIGNLPDRRIVGDDERQFFTLLTDILQEAKNLFARLIIGRTRRLVAEQHLGILG